jgi:hypothetical protein
MFLFICWFDQTVYIPVCMYCKYTKITYIKLWFTSESLVRDIPAGDRKIDNLFYSVLTCFLTYLLQEVLRTYFKMTVLMVL